MAVTCERRRCMEWTWERKKYLIPHKKDVGRSVKKFLPSRKALIISTIILIDPPVYNIGKQGCLSLADKNLHHQVMIQNFENVIH